MMATNQTLPAPQETVRTDGTGLRKGLRIKSGRSYAIVVRCPQLANARWSAQEARSGDTVQLLVDATDGEGEQVQLLIFEADADGGDDFVAALQAPVKQGRAQVEWTYKYVDDLDEEGQRKPYTKPEYYFECQLAGRKLRSGLLQFKDFIELTCVDLAGEPEAGASFILHLPDGGTRAGTLDAQGRARVDAVPPGPCWVEWQD